MTDDREPFREARAAGLKARQERRLENATYTAAEVKVLIADACKFAYALGRKEAGEEIAAAIGGLNRHDYKYDEFDVGTGAAVKVARDIASQPSPDATSGRTDPGDPNG